MVTVSFFQHVVICGHSDCKAVNLLYDIHTDPDYQKAAPSFSPLRNWVTVHGKRTMHEFAKLVRDRTKQITL